MFSGEKNFKLNSRDGTSPYWGSALGESTLRSSLALTPVSISKREGKVKCLQSWRRRWAAGMAPAADVARCPAVETEGAPPGGVTAGAAAGTAACDCEEMQAAPPGAWGR